MRVGLIAKKVAMSRIYDDSGKFIPVTLLSIQNCKVIGNKTLEKDGYEAVQLGFGKAKVKNVKKPQAEFFKKINIEPSEKVVEFRVSSDNLIEIGQELFADHFSTGQYVDVCGTSIGKGFAGVIKRHNFRSLRATHGVSLTHRSHGSTGQRQDPGRVFKGKKMAGHLGNATITTQNLQVMDANVEKGIILLKGSVPGSKGSIVLIKDAIKKILPSASISGSANIQ